MACQLPLSREDAGPVCGSALILLSSILEKDERQDAPRRETSLSPTQDQKARGLHTSAFSFSGFFISLATRDQPEVCPLSRGVMFQPLSAPLQDGIRFFRSPLPAVPTARLAARLPASRVGARRGNGFTLFHDNDTNGEGPACPPMAQCSTCRDSKTRQHGHLPFWLEPIAVVGSVMVTVFISGSLALTIPFSLAPHKRTARLIHASPRGKVMPSRKGLLCQGASHRAVTSPALTPRLPPVERRVRWNAGIVTPRILGQSLSWLAPHLESHKPPKGFVLAHPVLRCPKKGARRPRALFPGSAHRALPSDRPP